MTFFILLFSVARYYRITLFWVAHLTIVVLVITVLREVALTGPLLCFNPKIGLGALWTLGLGLWLGIR
jgi:hypothetical protein